MWDFRHDNVGISTHALDVQFNEARNYRREVGAAPGDTRRVGHYPGRPKREHKRREHILATFLAIRRARLLAKLDAALQTAADLLRPDDTLLQELQAAIEHQRQEAARQRARSPGQAPAPRTATRQPRGQRQEAASSST